MTKRPTINDIADKAGVSKRTVSRVINGATNVNAKTREKIQQIISEEGFSPDKKARGLASRRSYLLGIIYDNPGTFYIDQVQDGVLQVITDRGYELIVHPCDYHDAGFVENCIEFTKRSNVDGVIVLPPVSESEALASAFRQQHVNYVRMASVALDDPEKMVISDDRAAMREVADYLVSEGHHDFAVISGPQGFSSTAERLEGFCQALKGHGITIPSTRIIEGNNTYESGITCARELLQLTPRPGTIFANNDEMAIGVIRAAYDMGIAVPDSLRVIGFDDNLMAARIIPSLTTVRRPVAEMAAMAARKLLARIEGNIADNTSTQPVKASLIVRESTGKR